MATNYGGYMGKVMLIDLSTGQTQEYPWSDRERRLFLGGSVHRLRSAEFQPF